MSAPAVTIRLSMPSDNAFIAGLGLRTTDANVSPLRSADDESLELAFSRLLEFVMQNGSTIYVALVDGERAGFIILLDSLPDEVTLTSQGFIAYMAVEPQHRRRGVGRALLDAAEDWSRGLGLGALALMVTEANEAAMRLYTEAGFQTERRLLCKPL